MKKLVLFVWIIFSFLSLEAEILSEKIPSGTRDFLSIRVQFQEDYTNLTTGNGQFMLNEWTGHDTNTYALDTLPHDRSYFSSHLKFIDNYWNKASNGLIRINSDDLYQLPLADSAFTLSNPMRYYSDPDSLDYRLAKMIYESVKLAVDAGEYQSNNDALIIYHAGAGQDFKIDLDNSPFDIPSFFFDESYLSDYLPTDMYNELLTLNCRKGVVLPESQNQLGISIALNGTEILLTGMLLGLPTLYDIDLGRSGAGIYGLMDQGSNNGSGLCPIKPSAFERYMLGAVEPTTLQTSQTVTLLQDEVYKLPISSNEYFLVEFRKNTGMWSDSLLWYREDVVNYLDVLRVMDSLDLVDYTLENGVVTDVSDLDLTLAKSGVLIWHINEAELYGNNPNDWDSPFINLIEADGGDDIGKWYGSLNSTVNNGYKWDIWFHNNPGYFANNPTAYKLQFNNASFPASESMAHLPTGINIRNFAFHKDSVVISLEMDVSTDYNNEALTFDEMTTALPDDMIDTQALLAYTDSSLVLYNGSTLRNIYDADTLLAKGNTTLLTYNNDIILVTNSEQSSKVRHLTYLASSLREFNSLTISHPLDLDHIALYGNTLFLPPMPTAYSSLLGQTPEDLGIYELDIDQWDLNAIDTGHKTYIPYVQANEMKYLASSAAATMNDTLVYAGQYGFNLHSDNSYIDDTNDAQFVGVPANSHVLHEIIPIYLNDDPNFEVLALTQTYQNTTLAAFSNNGNLLNNFPIIENYNKIRVYYVDGEVRILAYDPAGIIDIYSNNATKLQTLSAPVQASTLFMEQVSVDTAWIVSDGCIYSLASDSVYWGYQGMDAAHTNAKYTTHTSIAIVSPTLIKDKLIYNYPNPIENSWTKFRFFATGANSVKIDIFQLDGRYIQTLTATVSDQQWNEIPWNIDLLQSGVYIAKIEISNDTKTETYFVKPAILR